MSRPGKGSAFAGVKNLHHLWPTHPFWDGETWPPPEIPVLFEPVQLEPSHPAFDYLNNRMHDAGVKDFRFEYESARLVLNDHGAWCLAQVLGKERGLTFPYPVPREWDSSLLTPLLPVALEFSGLSEFWLYEAKSNGKLIYPRGSIHNRLPRLHLLLGDVVVSPGPSGFAAALKFRQRIGRTVVILVGCDELRVFEGQREAWGSLFGADEAGLLEKFLEARRSRQLLGTADVKDWLVEIGVM